VMVVSFGTTFTTALMSSAVAGQSWYVQVPFNAAFAGWAAEVQGGDFRDGVLQSLKFAALFYTYRTLAGDTPMGRQRSNVNAVGDRLPEGSRESLLTLIVDGGGVTDADLKALGLPSCGEGSGCSRLFSKVPIVKAISWLHDWMTGSSPKGFPSEDFAGMGTVVPRPPSNEFMSSLGSFQVVNVGLMFPAAAWTIGAMAYQIGVVPQRW